MARTRWSKETRNERIGGNELGDALAYRISTARAKSMARARLERKTWRSRIVLTLPRTPQQSHGTIERHLERHHRTARSG
jgi:hypothetical protein